MQAAEVGFSGCLVLCCFGSEFQLFEEHRSAWIVVESDGILKCGDPFSCAGNPDCINDDGVSGNRTDEQTGDACTNPLPYKLNYDGGEVTFLFTDIEGTTRLWDQHPDDMSDALSTHDDLLQSAISDNAGYVFSKAGDGWGVAFESPLSALEQLAMEAE